ncbi:MAG: methyl-accepting chemotaxis protein, partial [Cyanobacteria bacterium P01_C01_bin.72]
MNNPKSGKLRDRTLLAVVAVVPPIILGIGFASYSAIKIIHQNSEEIISLEADKLEGNVSQWAKTNVLALKNMAEQPDIVSLDPKRQQPILKTLLSHHDNLYLAHTGNLNGINITRSDGKAPKNYSDRLWFKGAIAGNEFTEQALIGKTSKKPALCTAAPVKNEAAIVGTVTTCSSLDAIAEQVGKIDLGKTGIAIVVNEKGQVVAHSDAKYTSGDQLADFSKYPPVVNIMAGNEGNFIFTDDAGIEWVAYGKLLNNGWATFTLQHTKEAFAAEQRFKLVAIGSIIFVILVTTILVRESVSSVEKQAVKQRQEKERLEKAIYTLIEEVSDATDGDLTVRANLDSEELSTVADLFNAIIDNLQEIAIEAKESTSQVGSSLQQNESAIRLLAEQAIAEAKETRDTLLSVEHMSKSIQEVATNASQVEKITNDT